MKLKLLLTALSLTGLLLLGSTAASFGDEPKHWARSAPSPVIVTVYDVTGDAKWGEALQRAVSEWNAGTDHVEFQFAVGNPDCENGGGPYTVVVCIHPVAPGNGGEARTRTQNGHIYDVRIWLRPSSSQRWRIACHELGHALGLGHRPDSDVSSCMVAAPRSEHPDGADFQTVTNNHAHTH